MSLAAFPPAYTFLGPPFATPTTMRISRHLSYWPNLTILRIHQQMYGPQRFLGFAPQHIYSTTTTTPTTPTPAPPPAACPGTYNAQGFGIDIPIQRGAPETVHHAPPPATAVQAPATPAGAAPAVGSLFDIMT